MNQSELRFESWTDYLARANEPENGALWRQSRRTGNADWAGTETYEDAADLARDGWADGAERLSDLTARLTGRLSNVAAVRRIGYSMVEPGTLDIGRYFQGHPQCIQVWRPSDELTAVSPERILRVICNGSANANESTTSIYWRGAAAFAIADLAESSGVRVEVELAMSASGGDVQHTTWIVLKRAQDFVEPDLMAFALCHAATLRRLEFAIMETLPIRTRRTIGRHYGHSVDCPSVEGALVIPASLEPFRNAQTTAAWVKDALREQDIEVSEQ